MEEFGMSVSRIETIAPPGAIRKFSSHSNSNGRRLIFKSRTEMVRAARNALHRIFVDLANQCESWSLTRAELQELVSLNVRPAVPRDAP